MEIPIKQQTEISDVDLSANQYIKIKYGKFLFIYVFASVLFCIVFLWLGISRNLFATTQLYFLVIFLPLVPYIIVYALAREEIMTQFYFNFAVSNGFEYIGSKKSDEQFFGAIFKVGRSSKISHYVSGKISGFPFSLFNYSYSVGTGKNSSTYFFTVAELDFNSALPPALFINKNTDFGDFLADNNILNASKINLNQNFDKTKFDLYSERKFEIETLQIFSEEFINLLVSNFPEFSLDLIGKKLYIYFPGHISKIANLKKLMNLGSVLAAKLGEQLPQIRSSVEALVAAMQKIENQPLDLQSAKLRQTKQETKILLGLVFCVFIIVLFFYLITR